VPLDQRLHQLQAAHGTRQAGQPRAAADQPDRHPQVAGAQRQLPAWSFTASQSGSCAAISVSPYCCSGLTAPGLVQGEEGGVVLEVGAAGGVGRERRQQGLEFGVGHAGIRDSPMCSRQL
jgi:hypothetical protein